MLSSRVIPCLDVAAGRVVKGVHFNNLRDAGDPVELARRYDSEGADELVFLDIAATVEGREPLRDWIQAVAQQVFIPLTIGGGINDLKQFRMLLRGGADKISINSAALARPKLIEEAARAFGSQSVVVAVDARRTRRGWTVHVAGGRLDTGRDCLEWLRQAESLGAGEVLLTSMDCDGAQEGYDLELLERASEMLSVPLIASGGAGKPRHLLDALRHGADAVLAASIFHYDRYPLGEVKRYLAESGITVRPV